MMISKEAVENYTIPRKANPSNASKMAELVARYYYFEKRCDQATDELEAYAQNLVRRIRSNAVPKNAAQIHAHSEDPSAEKKLLATIADAPTDNSHFHYRAQMAWKHRVPYDINDQSSGRTSATEAELDELEDLDMVVRLLLFQLSDTEEEIMVSSPVSRDCALAKLQFLSQQINDGKFIEAEEIARTIRECTMLCEN